MMDAAGGRGSSVEKSKGHQKHHRSRRFQMLILFMLGMRTLSSQKLKSKLTMPYFIWRYLQIIQDIIPLS